MFDERRIDFLPSSLFLALSFARKVYEYEVSQVPDHEAFISKKELKKLIQQAEDPIELWETVKKYSKEIMEAAKIKGKLPEELPKDPSFVSQLMEMCNSTYREKHKKVYGVGIVEHFNNLNPQSMRSVTTGAADVQRGTHKDSWSAEKKCVLLSAVALEQWNLLSNDQLFSSLEVKKKEWTSPLQLKQLFSNLVPFDCVGKFVYCYDVSFRN